MKRNTLLRFKLKQTNQIKSHSIKIAMHYTLLHNTYRSGNYDCLNDELEGGVINAWIEEAKPEGAMLWHGDDEATEGLFSLKTEPNTRVRLCFDAVVGDVDDAVKAGGVTIPVGFNMRLLSDPRSLPDQEIGPDAERALLQVQAATRIQSDWGNLQDHYDFLRTRESINEALTDAIMSRVMGWTIAEACLVIFMAIAQVMYWRKFFEQRRYL
jgi:hypothetical protein